MNLTNDHSANTQLTITLLTLD